MCFHARMCLLGVVLILNSISGVKCPPNSYFAGVNKHFQAKRAKYSNFCTIKTTAAIPMKFCRVINTSKCFSVVIQNCDLRIRDGWQLPSLKYDKLLFSATLWLIFRIYTSYDMYPNKDVLEGSHWCCLPLRGRVLKIPISGGIYRHIQAECKKCTTQIQDGRWLPCWNTRLCYGRGTARRACQ